MIRFLNENGLYLVDFRYCFPDLLIIDVAQGPKFPFLICEKVWVEKHAFVM